MEIFWTILIVLLLAGSGLYLLAVFGLFLFQGRLLFVPSRQVWRTPADAGIGHEEVFLPTADGGRIHGWFVPAREAQGTVLFFHGNAGNMAHRLDTIAVLHNWRLNVFLIDYRGYGNSSGRPNEKALYHDADAAWRFLTEQKRISANRIVIFGRSLGSAVAAHLAARFDPAGVIVESGFVSIPEIAAGIYRWFPVRLLSRNHFPTLENVKAVRCPILVAHSREDDLIPFDHGERLFEAAGEPKFFLEMRGTHNDCVSATGVSYERAIRSFLHETLAVPQAARVRGEIR